MFTPRERVAVRVSPEDAATTAAQRCELNNATPRGAAAVTARRCKVPGLAGNKHPGAAESASGSAGSGAEEERCGAVGNGKRRKLLQGAMAGRPPSATRISGFPCGWAARAAWGAAMV
jgi:hypothetical protein